MKIAGSVMGCSGQSSGRSWKLMHPLWPRRAPACRSFPQGPAPRPTPSPDRGLSGPRSCGSNALIGSSRHTIPSGALVRTRHAPPHSPRTSPVAGRDPTQPSRLGCPRSPNRRRYFPSRPATQVTSASTRGENRTGPFDASYADHSRAQCLGDASVESWSERSAWMR